MNLWTPLEIKLGVLFGCLWAAFSAAIGGIDAPLTALFWLCIADFATGIYAGCKDEGWSSKKGHRGLLKKASIFLAIMLGFALDVAMGTQMLRSMFISGFAIIEALSIIENIDRCGYGSVIPEFIRSRLKQIKQEKKVEE